MTSNTTGVSLEEGDAQSKLEALKTLRKNLTEIQKKCNRLEEALIAHNRPTGSIRALPSEILSLIFRLYLDHVPRNIRRLMLVCRRWHHVTCTDTNLWTSIQITNGAHGDHSYTANIYRPYINACIRNSGSSLLRIELDFSDVVCWTQHQEDALGGVLSRLFPDLDYWNIQGWIRDQDWSWCGDDEAELPPGHYLHLMDLLDHLGHKDRWGALDVTLPEDEEVACAILTKLGGAMPRLHYLSISRYTGDGEGELDVPFEDLSSLSLLRVPNIRMLSTINISTSLQDLTVMELCLDQEDMAVLNQFASLCTLKVTPMRYHATLPPDIQLSLRLVNLRRLHIVGTVSGIEKVQYYLPSLQILLLTDQEDRSIDALPGVQPIEVHWSGRYYSGVAPGPITEKIMTQYPKVKRITAPFTAKKAVLEVILRRNGEGTLPEALEKVEFVRPSEIVEVVVIDDLRAS